uniref:Putative secreted protein n=1 Tax=Rhipicephalus microplus TaxID=6941 RepID=A0A6G5A2Y4_RHIMP
MVTVLVPFCWFVLQLIYHSGISVGFIEPTNRATDYCLYLLCEGVFLLIRVKLRALHYTGYTPTCYGCGPYLLG